MCPLKNHRQLDFIQKKYLTKKLIIFLHGYMVLIVVLSHIKYQQSSIISKAVLLIIFGSFSYLLLNDG